MLAITEKISKFFTHKRFNLIAFAITAGLILIAYSNTFTADFHFDDNPSIIENQALKRFTWENFLGMFSGTRPIVNLSLFFNYQVSGLNVVGWHIFNISFHILNTFFVYLLILRTLSLPSLNVRYGARATRMALFGALLFGLHPIQTESVTYIISRTELLATFFYLAAFLLFSKGVTSRHFSYHVLCCIMFVLAIFSKEWTATFSLMSLLYVLLFIEEDVWKRKLLWWYLIGFVAAVIAVFMLVKFKFSKEWVVTFPAIFLLYALFLLEESIFKRKILWHYLVYSIAAVIAVFMCATLSKDWTMTFPAMFGLFLVLYVLLLLLYALFFIDARTWRRELLWHILYFVVALLYIACLLSFAPLSGAGFGITGERSITPVTYLLTSFNVIWTYIRILFLPINQNLDYSYPIAKTLFEFPTILSFADHCCVVIAALLLYLKKRWTLIPFGIAWFYITLSPTQSFVPILDVIFEHRVYLPSIGFFIFFIVAFEGIFELFEKRKSNQLSTGVSKVS